MPDVAMGSTAHRIHLHMSYRFALIQIGAFSGRNDIFGIKEKRNDIREIVRFVRPEARARVITISCHRRRYTRFTMRISHVMLFEPGWMECASDVYSPKQGNGSFVLSFTVRITRREKHRTRDIPSQTLGNSNIAKRLFLRFPLQIEPYS